MKNNLFIILITFTSCQTNPDPETLKKEVYTTEKDFEKMASEKGIAEAFYFFADDNAVLNRNDSIISGKENIKNYYSAKDLSNVKLNWTPDFIEVSTDGSLAYTYGKYLWRVQNPDGTFKEHRGIFHSVWKKQPYGSWRYVCD